MRIKGVETRTNKKHRFTWLYREGDTVLILRGSKTIKRTVGTVIQRYIATWKQPFYEDDLYQIKTDKGVFDIWNSDLEPYGPNMNEAQLLIKIWKRNQVKKLLEIDK